MPNHKGATGANEIHVPHFQTYADATARLADATIVGADRRKLVVQTDDDSLWYMSDDSPLTYRRLDQMIGTARVEFDATAGLVTGSSPFNLGFQLPNNATIINAWYEVVTTFVSATAAAVIGLGVNTNDAAGVVAATAISAGGNVWDAGYFDGVPDGTAANFTTTTTAAREVQATLTTEDLTNGRLFLWFQWVWR